MSNKRIVRVRDVMKTGFDIVDGMDTVATALANMRYEENKCMLVKKRHDDDEYGIVMISDIARKVLAEDRAPARVNIYEIMSKPIIAVDADMDIRYCARLFDRFGLARAPVREGTDIVGVVGYTDMVLRGLMEEPPE